MLSELFKKEIKDLEIIINHLQVGVYITDGKGKTLLVNDESLKTGGLIRKDVVGKTVTELVKEGYIKESVTLKVLKSKRTEAMIQELGDGNKVFVSSKPLMENGKIKYVITTERDVTETQILKDILGKYNEKNERIGNELDFLRKKNLKKSKNIIADDPATKEILKQLMILARKNNSVLISGETGTGKETAANLLYLNSKRNNKPFIKINLATIPGKKIEEELFGIEDKFEDGKLQIGKPGCFELANEGVLLIDSVGKLPVKTQAKLLNQITKNNFDVRIISTTKLNLRERIAEGKFNSSLYNRLAENKINIKPLRKRKKDIEGLANFFVDIFNKRHLTNKHIMPEVFPVLRKYEWPGNIRELENMIERILVSFESDGITSLQARSVLYPNRESEYNIDEDAKFILKKGASLEDMLEEYERDLIVSVLANSKNAAAAAKVLKIEKSKLSRRMKKYDIG